MTANHGRRRSMMQILRSFATVAMLVVPLSLARGEPVKMHLKVDGGDVARMNTPMTAQVNGVEENAVVTLKAAGAGTIVAQVNAGTLRWIEPEIKARETKE